MTPRVVGSREAMTDRRWLLDAIRQEFRAEMQTTYDEYRAGSFSSPTHAASFWKFMASPALGGELLEPDDVLTHEEYRVLSKGASGGSFLVPEDVSTMVMSAARSASPIARLAIEYITEKGDNLSVPLAATHGTAAWVAESGAITPSDDTITEVELSAYKSNTKIIVSEELRQDAEIDFDRFLSLELGARVGALEAAAYAVGDGSGKPLGAVHASSPYTVSTAPTGNVTAYSKAAVLQFYLALPEAYRAEASWIMHPTDYGNLAALGDTGGMVFPGLQSAEPSMFGARVYIDANLPTPAASAKSLIFGNMRLAYGVRRVRDVSLKRQDEIHSDLGQIGYRLFARVDGRPLLGAAAIIGAHSAT